MTKSLFFFLASLRLPDESYPSLAWGLSSNVDADIGQLRDAIQDLATNFVMPPDLNMMSNNWFSIDMRTQHSIAGIYIVAELGASSPDQATVHIGVGPVTSENVGRLCGTMSPDGIMSYSVPCVERGRHLMLRRSKQAHFAIYQLEVYVQVFAYKGGCHSC